MNEFIKKLIERLEERKVHYGTLVVVGEDDLVLNYNLGKMHSYENAIEIVNQLAREYNKKYEPTMDLIEYGVDGYNLHLKEQYRKGYEDAKAEYNNESVKGDLISRSKVLRWINKQREEVTKKQVAGTKESIFTRENLVDMQRCLSTFETFINNQPTAYNDGWIPCSGRLPEENIEVDVTVEEIDGDRYTQTSWLQDGQWVIKKTPLKPKVIAWKERTAPYQPKGE